MKSHNIFICIRNGFSYLDSLSSQDVGFRKETLSFVNDFVYSGVYTSYKSKFLFLECGGLSDAVIAKKLKISEAGVRQARKRISEDAFSALGSDVVDLIIYGEDIKACKIIRKTLKTLDYFYTSDNFLFSDCLSCLNDSYIGNGISNFDLGACRKEMQFLRLLSIKYFSEIVSLLDNEKLNYLLRLLDSSTKDVKNRLVLLNYLSMEDGDLACLFDFLKSNLYKNKTDVEE